MIIEPTISVSHWGLFPEPPKRRITDRKELPSIIHRYRKPQDAPCFVEATA
jgi:hypothetical protein